jgi:hypothetical protein
MNYKENNVTNRAAASSLWPSVTRQDGDVLPYLLERYLLLENWDRDRTWSDPQSGGTPPMRDEVRYLHALLANATTVLLDQQERIFKLEAAVKFMQYAGQRLRGTTP